jgi:hypothetical protein
MSNPNNIIPGAPILIDFDAFEAAHGIQEPADWYQISMRHDLKPFPGGSSMMNKGSPVYVVCERYPELLPWLFNKCPRGFFDEFENRERYLCWLEEQFDIAHPTDWYNVLLGMIVGENGHQGMEAGLAFMRRYGKSLYRALCELRETTAWWPWMFQNTPNRFWHDANNQRAYVEWLSSQLNVEIIDFPGRVVSRIVRRNYGASLMANIHHNSVYSLLQTSHPEFEWDEVDFIPNTGFNPHAPGYYYVNRILDQGGNLLYYKGGISRDWEGRLIELRAGLPNHLEIDHLEHILFELGGDAQQLESQLLATEHIRAPRRFFPGGTELFSTNPLDYAKQEDWIESMGPL